MKCVPLDLGHIKAIVSTSGRRRRCSCGRQASKLCDWKIADGRTCDALLCDGCTYEPAPGKDLCPMHRAMWEERLKQRAARAAKQESDRRQQAADQGGEQ